ncbi:helix-hairpin-helix domain-containing protein [Methylobacterium gossipiicola]|uniref:Helix-hairpin-helix motif-containing protein n=1 Tax=Methylobacterium gossipiicola TaxID=582675 RepID=A0A1I2TFK6_9HYPH|nr:helix-hairpin-helix domain-containing protein [Methylobacterium gossipiicola]SFG61316.1 Helix-hairpin-helix motif-containing protein [Methylobacterium gossipiicola]
MLSGSAFLRVALLFIVAAGLTSLIQFYWLPRSAESEPVAVVGEPARPVRRVDLAPVPAPPPAPPKPPAEVPPAPLAQTPAVPAPAPAPQVSAAPIPEPPSPPPVAAPRETAPPPAPEDAADAAADNAGPRAMAIVDLNTASVADLNRLKGGGMIGRSIVQKRPYASVDQLLSKRVLNRATYERIKDQVTVR